MRVEISHICEQGSHTDQDMGVVGIGIRATAYHFLV